MDYPASKHLGAASDPEGRTYNLEFYGENEGAAVVGGPIIFGGAELHHVPEVHREPAKDADEAREKLAAWTSAKGWR